MAEPRVRVPATATRKEREEVPAHVFLLPSERKFPYKRYKNGEWVISCADLRDAIRLAAIHGYKSVEAKARKLYEEHCKGE